MGIIFFPIYKYLSKLFWYINIPLFGTIHFNIESLQRLDCFFHVSPYFIYISMNLKMFGKWYFPFSKLQTLHVCQNCSCFIFQFTKHKLCRQPLWRGLNAIGIRHKTYTMQAITIYIQSKSRIDAKFYFPIYSSSIHESYEWKFVENSVDFISSLYY